MNRRYLSYLLLFNILLGACKLYSQELTIAGTESLKLKEFRISSSKISTNIYVVIMEASSTKVKVAGFSKENKSGVSPIGIINTSNAKVVLGSGFVKSFYPITPNGFLKIDNKLINELKTSGYNGIVGSQNNKLQLLRSNSAGINTLKDGFQTGPILIEGGVVKFKPTTQNSMEKYNRAFIGINTRGQLIAAVTTVPVTLQALSEFLTTSPFPDIKCTQVINLSGGGSEVLVVKVNDNIYKYGSYSLYESALLVFY